jgi:CheY-like chemotaxis protein
LVIRVCYVSVTAAAWILVVEDDDDLRAMLVEMLREERFQVHEARNGQEALEHIGVSGPPAAILLDHIMPVMDAMTFLQERSRQPSLQRIPVILLTALDPTKIEWPDGVEQITVHGKPVDIDVLLSSLRRMCA